MRFPRSFSLFFLFLSSLSISCHATFRRGQSPPKRKTGFDRYLDSLYEQADLNQDGKLSFDECYQRLLVFYLYLNRQAPINPPTRQKIRKLYGLTDWNRNQSLHRDEFRRLAQICTSRAATRLVFHKLVTMVIAPLVALTLVQELPTTAWVHHLQTQVLPQLPGFLQDTLQSPGFWTGVFMVLTISQLANLLLKILDWIFETYQPYARLFAASI